MLRNPNVVEVHVEFVIATGWHWRVCSIFRDYVLLQILMRRYYTHFYSLSCKPCSLESFDGKIS